MVVLHENNIICEALDSLHAQNNSLHNDLDIISQRLAQDRGLRQQIGDADPSIWPKLRIAWLNFANIEDNNASGSSLLSTARFTRNITAGIASNQEKAFSNEPEVRKLIYQYTAFSVVQDSESHQVSRMLIQTLSNLVTSNEMLMTRIWEIYMTFPEEQNILIRMLAHPDNQTIASSMVLILNCIHKNPDRMLHMISTPAGIRVCVSLLDQTSMLAERDESSDRSKAFEIAYNIFAQLFDNDLAPQLFKALSMQGETVTPYQINFLKLLDSYLLQSNAHASNCVKILPFMTAYYFELLSHAQTSIRKSLGTTPEYDSAVSEERKTLQELDLLLPKVCEGLVLISQCFCTMTLAEENTIHDASPGVKQQLNEAVSPDGQDLLRLLDEFLPRITLLTRTRPSDGPAGQSAADTPGFNYLKRDLVRLLGILCYNDKAVQDRVRACEGITVVMNLCVIDDRNPYLREHALLALRNLLHGNMENQAVVDQMQPISN